ncbi:MAG: OmpH family outer membrane protein [Prolixibacteraceae bacterium]|nr:OmpH family outer membrane protein [Prolixibacteraceae bacterium]
MKSFYKICLSLMIFLSTTGLMNAQTLKFGHIDTQALIQTMPETAIAQKSLQTQAKGLEDQLGTMQKEFQTKLSEYTQSTDSLTDLVRQAKEQELQDLQSRIKAFNGTAQQNLQKKQTELMKPVLDKANKAIADVAKEKGLIYVFDTNTVIYKSSASLDLLPLVKSKLGIQ